MDGWYAQSIDCATLEVRDEAAESLPAASSGAPAELGKDYVPCSFGELQGESPGFARGQRPSPERSEEAGG